MMVKGFMPNKPPGAAPEERSYASAAYCLADDAMKERSKREQARFPK
jgi:hypothetical protein